MPHIIQILNFEILCDDFGNYARVEAIVDDAVQAAPATLYDPAVFQAAPCVANVLLSDDDDLSEYEHDDAVMQLAQEIPADAWEAIQY